MTVRTLAAIIYKAGTASIADQVPRLGAALAFYMTFSLAPLLLVVVVLASFAAGRQMAERELFSEIKLVVGDDVAITLQSLISSIGQHKSSIVATLLGATTVLIGAIGFFCELQSALNIVFEVPTKSNGSAWSLVRSRFLSFLLIVGCGILLVMSVLLSTAASAVIGMLKGTRNEIWLKAVSIHAVQMPLSFFVITLLFVIVYRFLPDTTVQWKDAWFGSVASAILFTLGKFLFGLYLGQVAMGSVYGAAASILILMLWNYYSAQIFLLGAELTKIHSYH